jgi:hypothetical protein
VFTHKQLVLLKGLLFNQKHSNPSLVNRFGEETIDSTQKAIIEALSVSNQQFIERLRDRKIEGNGEEEDYNRGIV